MKIEDLINSFKTSPFLFVGSGLTRRYYGLPSWDELLKIFIKKINKDEFAYASYYNETKGWQGEKNIKIAELLENDFNNVWYKEQNIRNLDETRIEMVKNGLSPFKAEISQYIINNSKELQTYKTEIDKLRELSVKSVSGVITTNYDCFLENNFKGYKTFVGQEELLFSELYGTAEIYKIHGCVTNPESIIINVNDYKEFNRKNAYLIAKLITIFLEYPMVFIGYSLKDPNIQNILKSIVDCLGEKDICKLQNRLIMVEYCEHENDIVVESMIKDFDGKNIQITKIKTGNYEKLYEEIGKRKNKLPVKLLRQFREELYEFTLSNKPNGLLRIAELDSERIGDEELVLAIAKPTQIALKGLSGITSSEWYRDIILDDLKFSSDDLLEYAYPTLIRQANVLPLYKHLSKATKEFDICRKKAQDQKLFSNTINKNRYKKHINDRSVKGVIAQFGSEKAIDYLSYLTLEEINEKDLFEFIYNIFEKDKDLLEKRIDTITVYKNTNVRRLIRIYDELKYKKRESSK